MTKLLPLLTALGCLLVAAAGGLAGLDLFPAVTSTFPYWLRPEHVSVHWEFIPSLTLLALAIFTRSQLRAFLDAGIWQRIVAVIALSGIALFLLASTHLSWLVVVARFVFLSIAILLPGILYLLFISTRKPSLLGEILFNVQRLGLLDSQGVSGTDEQRRRLGILLQKFEASYGALTPQLRQRILENPGAATLSDVTMSSAQEISGGLIALVLSPTMLPVILATALITFGWIMVMPLHSIRAYIPQYPSNPSTVLSMILGTPILAGFLGAYMFSLYTLLWRFVIRDLRPNAYVSVCFRILVTVIVTGLLQNILDSGTPEVVRAHTPYGSVIALGFFIGFFPHSWYRVLKSWANAPVIHESIKRLDSRFPLREIDGLTVWHEQRLEEEDIVSVPGMANASLSDLMLNTRLRPNQLVHWVDQAILYAQLGNDPAGRANRDSLTRMGIRTASNFIDAFESAQTEDERKALDKVFQTMGPGTSKILHAMIRGHMNLAQVLAWRTHVPGSATDHPSTRIDHLKNEAPAVRDWQSPCS